MKRFIYCYYNLQFKRKNILEPLNSHFGSGRFRMTLTFLLIFFNSCAIEQVCFTTLVVLYTQQVYVSQPLWYCIVLCRLVFHNPFGYVLQPLWYCVKSQQAYYTTSRVPFLAYFTLLEQKRKQPLGGIGIEMNLRKLVILFYFHC